MATVAVREWMNADQTMVKHGRDTIERQGFRGELHLHVSAQIARPHGDVGRIDADIFSLVRNLPAHTHVRSYICRCRSFMNSSVSISFRLARSNHVSAFRMFSASHSSSSLRRMMCPGFKPSSSSGSSGVDPGGPSKFTAITCASYRAGVLQQA